MRPANFSIYVMYAICLIAACLINVFNIRITAGLNTISAYWHMIGVAFIVIVLILVPDDHQSFGYVFGETVNASGYGNAADNFSSPAFWFVFGLGLLLSQYTITGLRRVRAHGGGDEELIAHGCRRDVHGGRRRRSCSAGSCCSP